MQGGPGSDGGGNAARPGEEAGLGIWGRCSEGVELGRGWGQGGMKKKEGGGQNFFLLGAAKILEPALLLSVSPAWGKTPPSLLVRPFVVSQTTTWQLPSLNSFVITGIGTASVNFTVRVGSLIIRDFMYYTQPLKGSQIFSNIIVLLTVRRT